ncbi:MAG TPA: right-handed parallel beta-helix repeat-containing protein, partial [Anaerolineales bacterium]|nr:right-handed parallel beta-helix repeat-containing protein [Anaerolineales bacterium]
MKPPARAAPAAAGWRKPCDVRVRRLLASLGLALAFLSVAANVSATGGTLLISSDTTLTEDHHGDVVIAADNVVLDCAGHRLLGSGEAAGVLIEGRTGGRVVNCRVSGFQRGFEVSGSTLVVLAGNQASQNEIGFRVATGDQVWAHDNQAEGNGQGFVIDDTASSDFINNRATNNRGDGFLWTDSDRNSIEGNIAEGNGGHGFRLSSSDGNELSTNLARHNQDGFVFEDSSGSALSGNQAADNEGDGFLLVGARLSHLDHNTASGNGRDGFHLERSFDVEFSENVTLGNGGYEVAVEESSNIAIRPSNPRAGVSGGPGYPYLPEFMSFLGLASTIWLGVFLVGQPRRTPVAWLTALSLWALGGIFLNDFMGFNQPAVGFLEQIRRLFDFWPGADEVLSRLLVLGWVSKFAAVFWFHATTRMRPGPMGAMRKALVIVGYGMATAAVLIQLFQPTALATRGSIYPVFAAGLLFFLALSLANLAGGVRRARSEIERRQFLVLLAATLLACLSGFVYLAGAWAGLPLPLARTALLWLAVLPLGYGVANYSAIVEGRTIRRHFMYSLTAVALVTLLYFLVSYLSSLSFGIRTAAFAFVILLAVVTHSLAGNAPAVLDRFLLDPDAGEAMRAFRQLPNRLAGEGRLEERLSLALDTLCTQLRASYGLVLLGSDGAPQLAAAYHWPYGKEAGWPSDSLAADDITLLEPGRWPPPFEGAALLAPLYLDLESVGCVILGQPVNAARYGASDGDLAGYATDRMAEIIRVKRLEDEAV